MFLARGGAIDGQQRQVLQLAAALSARGHRVLVGVDRPGCLLDQLVECGIAARLLPMRSWRSPLRLLQARLDAYRILQIAAAHGTQLVHAHDHWRAPHARFVAERLSVPHVVHVRGPIGRRHIAKYRIADADATIAIAGRYVESLVDAGVGRSRIHLVGDGVDLGLFDPCRAGDRKVDFNIGDTRGKVLVGMVGRIEPFKRVTGFVDIVAALPPEVRRHARFLLIGETDPEYETAVRRRIQSHALQDDILFCGRSPADRMPAIVAGLDLLVTLSGGSIMFEAMAMGTTVLSVREDGLHSQYTIDGETAICVSGPSASRAAAALRSVIEGAELRRYIARKARELVVRELSAERIADETERVYRALAGSRERMASETRLAGAA